MSAATIDRLLGAVREQASGGRKKKATRVTRVGKLVPVRTFGGLGISWTRLLGDRSGSALRDKSRRQLCTFAGTDGHRVGMD